MAKGGGSYLLKGLTRKNPPQRAAGDPKKPTKSLDADATRSSVAKTPRTLGPRTA
jgi:hypothetical protein